jgi:hypothetical protein
MRYVVAATGAVLFLLAGFTGMNESESPHYFFLWFAFGMAALIVTIAMPGPSANARGSVAPPADTRL